MKSKFLLFLAALIILGCGLHEVKALKIDAIKTFDNGIDNLISTQYQSLDCCNQSKINVYGSLSTSNWKDNATNILNMRLNEGSTGLCYRYGINFTSELGYNDIYYLNQSILNACKLSIQFYAWGQREEGFFSEVDQFHGDTKLSPNEGFSNYVLIRTYIENQKVGNILGQFNRLIKIDSNKL